MLETLTPFLPALAQGLALTLFYFALGAAGSMMLGLPMAFALGSSRRFVRYPAVAFVEFFRNTPLLVQLFWLHFALPAISGFNTSAQQTAGLAIVIVMTAYMAEVYRAGFMSVGKGQYEAALALGLKPAYRWRLVILPQALAVAMPAISNTLVSLLKATAILSVLSVPELMRTTSRISDYTADPILFYSVAAIIYIGSGLALSGCLSRVEHRLNRWRTR